MRPRSKSYQTLPWWCSWGTHREQYTSVLALVAMAGTRPWEARYLDGWCARDLRDLRSLSVERGVEGWLIRNPVNQSEAGKSPGIETRVFQSKTSSRNNPTKGTVHFRLPFVVHGRLCLSFLITYVNKLDVIKSWDLNDRLLHEQPIRKFTKSIKKVLLSQSFSRRPTADNLEPTVSLSLCQRLVAGRNSGIMDFFFF